MTSRMSIEESLANAAIIAKALLEREGAVTALEGVSAEALKTTPVWVGPEADPEGKQKPKALTVLLRQDPENQEWYVYLVDPRNRSDPNAPVFMITRETIEYHEETAEALETLLSASIRASEEEGGYHINPKCDRLLYLGKRDIQRKDGGADAMDVAIVFMSEEPQLAADQLDCLGRIKTPLAVAAQGAPVELEELQKNPGMYTKQHKTPPSAGVLGIIKPEHLPILQEVLDIVAARKAGHVPPLCTKRRTGRGHPL